MYAVCQYLIDNYLYLIDFPSGLKAKQSAIKFQNICGLPNAIAAIDGTHIKIQRPKHRQEIYYNRKAYHSYNV